MTGATRPGLVHPVPAFVVGCAASREEILAALRDYEGTVILVTHDPGAVTALNPQRVLLLPDADEDLWDDSYLDLVTLT